MIYFTADTHFGHENVIRFCSRPFSCAAEMDEALIANWNSRVKGNDTVYILGDMFFRSVNFEEILKRLKGKKRLIVGNHDGSWMTKADISRYFESIDKFLETTDGQHALTLCHYPMVTWKHARRSYMIHGHIHNDTSMDYWPLLAARDNVLNAGADINGLMPVTFDELMENNRNFKRLSAGKESLMKRFRKNLYTIEKIVWVRHQMQYIKDKDGYLFSDMVYPTKIKPEDLPEWYVHGRYYKRWGYLSAKGVADLKYIPNLWVNHFLKDDFLLISYHEPIREVPDGKWIWEKYTGFETTISGNEILRFLKATRKYSGIDISEIAGQIQEKADMLPQKHPREFKDFRFDVQAYLNQA